MGYLASKVFLVHAVIILLIALLFSVFTGICKGQEFVEIPRESYFAETFGSETFADVYSNKLHRNKKHQKYEFDANPLTQIHETVHSINADYSLFDAYQFIYLQDGLGYKVRWSGIKTREIINILPDELKELCRDRYKTYVLEMQDRDIVNLLNEWSAYQSNALMSVEMFQKYGYSYEKCGVNELEGMLDMQVFALFGALKNPEWFKDNKSFFRGMLARGKVIYNACNKDARMMGNGNKVLEFLNGSEECRNLRMLFDTK